jgi:hypothetical protein
MEVTMAWARLVIAAALFALATATASAQDAPSYESRGYGGPLYVGPNFQTGGKYSPPTYDSNSYSRERYKERRVYQAPKRHSRPEPEKTHTVKATPANDDAEKVKDKADNENSGIAQSARAKADSDSDTKAGTAKGVQNENSTIARASLDTDTKAGKSTAKSTSQPASDPKTTQNVGCKKYFPAVGLTLSVPCE